RAGRAACSRSRHLAGLARGRELPRPIDPGLPRAERPRRPLARGRDRRRPAASHEPWRRSRALGPRPLKPAFYALRPGGWRDYVTLLHPPYTLWHLSYVALGAAIAPEWRPLRLGTGLAAFALGLGVGAHALDELRGRPLGTRIPAPVLWTL